MDEKPTTHFGSAAQLGVPCWLSGISVAKDVDDGSQYVFLIFHSILDVQHAMHIPLDRFDEFIGYIRELKDKAYQAVLDIDRITEIELQEMLERPDPL